MAHPSLVVPAKALGHAHIFEAPSYGDGRVDLRHSVPDVLASTANLLHTNGFKMGAPYGEGSANFEAMREWNHAVIYRKTIGYFADQLVGR